MKDQMDKIRSIIRLELHKAYGQEILYAKDCQSLSISIQQKTKRTISASTLKRLFRIIEYPYHPSQYTLDTLAIYLNYAGWKELAKSHRSMNLMSSDEEYWDILKNRIARITEQSLSSMKAKLGDQFSDFQVREFAIRKFDMFLKSPKTASAFIAPEGYGKTTIVAQLTELFFLRGAAFYPDDIVCLIDGSILINLIYLNQEIVRMLDITDMEERNNFSNYFRKNPDQVKGRFILIIESLYQIYHQEEKLSSFVENLMDIITAYKHLPWFKLLITCRPDNWKIFANVIRKDPDLKSQWYGVDFAGPVNESINVPLLSKNEIKHYLTKRHSAKSVEKLKFYHPDITEICNTPFMLNLFSTNQNPQHINSDLELLDYFVSNKILVEPYLQEKSSIIHEFFIRSDYLKQCASIDKLELPTSAEYGSAYKELLFHNVLYEYTIQGKYLAVKTYVKFSDDILLAFFLANKWIEKHGLDLELVRMVLDDYRKNPGLQTYIVKFMVKIAFKEERMEVLKDIFSLLESEGKSKDLSDISLVHREIINTVGVELRHSKKIRKILIPHYARSKAGQLYYFEGFFDMDSLILHSGDHVNKYLENKQSREAMIHGHFLKFMQYFLSCNQALCKNEYDIIRNLELSDHMEPALAGYYHGAQLIYQSYFGNGPDPELMEKVFQKSRTLFKRKLQPVSGIPMYEYIINYSLNYGDEYTHILELSELALKKYEIALHAHSWKHQLFMLIYARALLNAGNKDIAISIFRKIEMGVVPVNNKYYHRLRYYLIQLEFLLFQKKKTEALYLIKEIKTISKIIRHQFFYERVLFFEKKVKML